MSLESEFFKRMAPDFRSFPDYGFFHDSAGWHYSQKFLDDEFRADITVTDGGEVSGTVIDLDLEEEYLPLRVPRETGAFVGQVREEYASLLGDIADNCFYKLPFLSEQANHIAAKVLNKWGEGVDHPFSKWPSYGSFRNADTQKWYGLVMNIPRSKLKSKEQSVDEAAPKSRQVQKGSAANSASAGNIGKTDPEIEVLNVKVAPSRLNDFLEEPGIYPAYHMNKKSWVSIILDGTVPDERIMGMLEVSRRFSTSKSSARRKNGRIDTWLVPANPKYYDIESAFEQYDEIIWKQSTNVQIGDIAYMYVAAPVSAILFKCVITATDIPYEHFGAVKIKKVMKIKFLEKYRRDQFPLKVMKKHGVGTVQGCHGMPEEMERYIRKKTEK